MEERPSLCKLYNRKRAYIVNCQVYTFFHLRDLLLALQRTLMEL